MANPQTPNDWKKAIGRFEASGRARSRFGGILLQARL